MSAFEQFYGSGLTQTPKVLINNFSTTNWTPITCNTTTAQYFGFKSTLSGAMTANTLTTVLSVTGGGVLNILGAIANDTTSRTIRMKLTLDGVVVFDSTSSAITTAAMGGFCVGQGEQATVTAFYDAIPFTSSCLFEVASSLTETDKLTFYTRYRTT